MKENKLKVFCESWYTLFKSVIIIYVKFRVTKLFNINSLSSLAMD